MDQQPDGSWQCHTCKRETTAKGNRVLCGCDTACAAKVRDDPVLPNIFKRGWNYCKAVKRWKRAGKPVRTKAQIEAIRPICEACPLFNAVKRACSICGCPCDENENPLENMIAMATETCPDNPPRWT